MRSRTAEAAAFQRAAHATWDDEPALFDDRAVLPLLSSSARLWLRLPRELARPRALAQAPAQRALAQMRGQIVLRARFAEDCLQQAIVQRGVTQYLVLSAGLDTFALRRADLAQKVSVFELDHPDTQRWKRARLGGRIPRNLHFISVDFERQGIAEALGGSAFDPLRPVFCSWLGTTYYLSKPAIRATLTSLASVAAPGSELVLDYWSAEPGIGWQAAWLLAGVRVAVAMQREPMKSFFTPAAIAREAEAAGFELVRDLSPDQQRRTYLRGRRDLDIPGFARLLHLRKA